MACPQRLESGFKLVGRITSRYNGSLTCNSDEKSDLHWRLISMMKEILEIDRSLSAVANLGIHSTFLDLILSFLTGSFLWIFLFLGYFLYITYHKDWSRLRILFVLAVLLVLADFLAYGVLKPYFGRIRPCKVLYLVRISRDVGCAGWQSFPSNHATNAMVVFTWFSIHVKKTFILPAALLTGMVGFSRIYFGVHYPIDVIGGYCVGFFVALVGAGIWYLISELGSAAKRARN